MENLFGRRSFKAAKNAADPPNYITAKAAPQALKDVATWPLADLASLMHLITRLLNPKQVNSPITPIKDTAFLVPFRCAK